MSWYSSDHVELAVEAIEAAIYRVHPEITAIGFLVEFIGACLEARLDRKGHLQWRRSVLGRRLLVRLAAEQNWRCCYCGVRATTYGSNIIPTFATFEHVLPRCMGGNEHPDNLVMACTSCNSSRGAKMSNGAHVSYECCLEVA